MPSGTPAGSSALLQGRACAIARGAWLVVATLALVLVLISIPAEYARFQIPARLCPVRSCRSGRRTSRRWTGLVYQQTLPVFCWPEKHRSWPLLWQWARVILAQIGTAYRSLCGAVVGYPGQPIFSGSFKLYVCFRPFWQGLALVLAFVGNTTIVLCFYLFPDGRFVLPGSRYWRSSSSCCRWTSSSSIPSLSGSSRPICGCPFYLGSMIYAQVYCYWRVSGKIERQQTKWVVPVLRAPWWYLCGPGSAATASPSPYPGVHWEHPLLFVSAPHSALDWDDGILRYRLWDIDNLINRTLVYGTLTVLVIVLYVLIVGSLSALLPTSGNLVLSLIATGVIAVLFQPLRERLQRGANVTTGSAMTLTASYRTWDGAWGRRLAEALLPNVVETIAQALKVPYVAVALRHGSELHTAAAYGRPSTRPGPPAARLPG